MKGESAEKQAIPVSQADFFISKGMNESSKKSIIIGSILS